MRQRQLGNDGPLVSAVGLGCMGMSEFYGPVDEAMAIDTLYGALEMGVTFFDTAQIYGLNGANEKLLGKAFTGRWSELTLATKCGIIRDESGQFLGLDGTAANAQRACEQSLKRLKTECIDLYYLHRVDPATPIEETVAAMAGLVEQGKIKHIGLSEVACANLRRAHAVHPITAVQSEYSIFSRDVEQAVMGTCEELGVAFVPYSPLGRGLLTGQVRQLDTLASNDYRRIQPRFNADNLTHNLTLVEQIQTIADQYQSTAAQIALAWVLQQGEHIIPIPGTTKLKNLQNNIDALKIQLSDAELAQLNQLSDQVAGSRYDESGMQRTNV